MNRAYPVGTATYSKHHSRYPAGVPKRFEYASGAWVNERAPVTNGPLRFSENPWLDLTSGLGAVILGHNDPDVTRAIAEQLNLGISYPLPHRLEQEVAELLLEVVTWRRAESVRFGKNGADVTSSAVRLARAVTGRTCVLYADYHGHHDWCMTEPPKNGGVFVGTDAYGYPASEKVGREYLIEALENDGKVYAAVVLEGFSSYDPTPDWPDFWPRLRRACDDTGTLLILDEMISGFRCTIGGAAELLGIEPDLACYGKAMANGMPLSAIVGPFEYLQRYEDDVFFSITHGGEALSLAAAKVTMGLVLDAHVTDKIGDLGREIIGVLGRERVHSFYPQRLVFNFTPDQLAYLASKHILCAGYANLTLAHATDSRARELLLETMEEL